MEREGKLQIGSIYGIILVGKHILEEAEVFQYILILFAIFVIIPMAILALAELGWLHIQRQKPKTKAEEIFVLATSVTPQDRMRGAGDENSGAN